MRSVRVSFPAIHHDQEREYLQGQYSEYNKEKLRLHESDVSAWAVSLCMYVHNIVTLDWKVEASQTIQRDCRLNDADV